MTVVNIKAGIVFPAEFSISFSKDDTSYNATWIAASADAYSANCTVQQKYDSAEYAGKPEKILPGVVLRWQTT
jgi:predicted HicB family RNase H-like nuclease